MEKAMNTKIYGTIGPACQDTDTLVRLFEKGMTGVRLNLSHTDLAGAAGWIAHIREAYVRWKGQEPGQQPAAPELLIDLRGPELRLGTLARTWVPKEGEHVTLMTEQEGHPAGKRELLVPEIVISHLSPGQEVLLNDGKILLKVDSIKETNGRCVRCDVLRGGEISSGKSITLPGVKVHPPTLTKSDLKNIREAKRYGVTGVMLPFVRNKEDLMGLKQTLINEEAGDIRIFAKIENMDGVQKLPELLPYCDEIVIARGDLGNAMPLWELPVVQAQIAALCRQKEKPFMVVTQMLASMEQAAVPTRAEVSDIFRAVWEGAASVMLTGETAVGKYPVEAMEYFVNTVREAEKYRSIK